MKKSILFLMILLLVNKPVEAKQENLNQNEFNKIKNFYNKTGVLTTTKTIELGKKLVFNYNDFFLDAVIIDSKKSLVKGVVINTNTYSKVNKTEASIFIDYDELKDLIDSINYIKDFAEKNKEISIKDSIKISFKTSDNFKIGFTQENLKQEFFVSVDGIYMSIRESEFKYLDDLKNQLQDAINLLK